MPTSPAVPGIVPLTSTALVDTMGIRGPMDAANTLAAWLRLVQRQMATGSNPKLLGISKRENGYLPKLIFHGPPSSTSAFQSRDTSGRTATKMQVNFTAS